MAVHAPPSRLAGRETPAEGDLEAKSTRTAPTADAVAADSMSRFRGATDDGGGVTAPRARVRVWFWVRRYLPAEVAGTLTALAVGMVVFAWSTLPILTAVAATLAESIGFYAVLAVAVYREQRRLSPRRREAALRGVLLLIAEFGPAEVIDTVIIRPGAISLTVWLMDDPFWAILVGKLAADVVFYAIAAFSFTITARTGLRGTGRRDAAAGS